MFSNKRLINVTGKSTLLIMKAIFCRIVFVSTLFIAGCSGSPSGHEVAVLNDSAQQDSWVSLFNGRDLTGWTVKFKGYEHGDNYHNTFRVTDGLLTVSYADWPNFDDLSFGHIFTNQAYSNYRIRLEYRFVGEQLASKTNLGWAFRNNGVMLHSQSAESMGLDQAFPISAEAQLLGGNGKDARPTGNLCSPGTNIIQQQKLITSHCLESTSATFHGDQWVLFEAEVRDDGSIKHFINGELVFEYSQLQLDPLDPWSKKLLELGQPLMITKGHIALQAESHPTQFRRIEIKYLN